MCVCVCVYMIARADTEFRDQLRGYWLVMCFGTRLNIICGNGW